MACDRHPSDIPTYLLVQSALGCAMAILFAAALWLTDTGSFGSLLSNADAASTFIVLFSSIIIIIPLVVATAIGLLGSHHQK
jgi:hypothetical protein